MRYDGFPILEKPACRLDYVIRAWWFAMVTGVIWTIAGDIGGKALSSTVIGVFDWAVYMGAAVQAVMFGFVKDKFGWPAIFIIIGVLYIILLVLTFVAKNMKTKKI